MTLEAELGDTEAAVFYTEETADGWMDDQGGMSGV